ncbi:hypothetical protein A2U01_0020412, partial [Trifolium medium]|nr:hypothetical protein [Trifolium medium]
QAADLLSVLDNNAFQQGVAANRVFVMCQNEDLLSVHEGSR